MEELISKRKRHRKLYEGKYWGAKPINVGNGIFNLGFFLFFLFSTMLYLKLVPPFVLNNGFDVLKSPVSFLLIISKYKLNCGSIRYQHHHAHIHRNPTDEYRNKTTNDYIIQENHNQNLYCDELHPIFSTKIKFMIITFMFTVQSLIIISKLRFNEQRDEENRLCCSLMS
jgi:hypothetical protein